MKKITRTINLILEIDWEDYEDVDEQLILDDAIREIADGVSIRIANIKSDCPTCGKPRTYGKFGLNSCCVDAGDDC